MAIYVNKELAKKYLSTPDETAWFYLESGKALKNIYDLRDFLKKAEESDYNKYAKNNDFYNWINGVFSNHRLAEALAKARTSNEARLYVDRNIAMLEKNASR